MTDEEFKKLLSEAITTEDLWTLSDNEDLTQVQKVKAARAWYDSYCTDIIISMGR